MNPATQPPATGGQRPSHPCHPARPTGHWGLSQRSQRSQWTGRPASQSVSQWGPVSQSVSQSVSQWGPEEQFHYFDAFPVSGSPHNSTSATQTSTIKLIQFSRLSRMICLKQNTKWGWPHKTNCIVSDHLSITRRSSSLVRSVALMSASRPNLSLGTQGYLPQSAKTSLR